MEMPPTPSYQSCFVDLIIGTIFDVVNLLALSPTSVARTPLWRVEISQVSPPKRMWRPGHETNPWKVALDRKEDLCLFWGPSGSQCRLCSRNTYV